jgi:hypothetical protein
MRRRVRLKLTRTSEQTIVLPHSLPHALCPVCKTEVEVLTVEQSTMVLNTEQSALSDLIANRIVHLVQTETGNKVVCKDSLIPK